MNNKRIARELIKIAKELVADYKYDPKHKHRPSGGGNWQRTEKGWSTDGNKDPKHRSFKQKTEDWIVNKMDNFFDKKEKQIGDKAHEWSENFQKGLMKPKTSSKIAKEVGAGTWSLPKNNSDVNKIVKYIKKMAKGEEPVEGREITDIFYNLIGDDNLFDKLRTEKEYYLKDCANTIIDEIKRMIKDGEQSFTKKEYYNNLISILKKFH